MSYSAFKIAKIADDILKPDDFSDYCFNGLQLPNSGRSCLNIASAVTASLDAIRGAVEFGADILLVHHGLFWRGDELRINDINYERIKLMMSNDMALLAYHLPLDEHSEFGNNALLGLDLGISFDLQVDLGMMQPTLGRLADFSISVDELKQRLESVLNRGVMHFPYGPQQIKRLAWCTGAAQDGIILAKNKGADAFISGEVSERTYHLAKELGLHYFAVGHHASERYGVRSFGEHLANMCNLKHTYIELGNPV